MKAFIIIMAITFGMYVRITSGFYKGCTGIVTDYFDGSEMYTVDLRCKMANGVTESKTANFKANQMQQIK